MATLPTAPTAAPKRSWFRRWLRRFGLFVLFLVILALGVVIYHRTIGGRRLTAAIAAADQQDPGWHWDDLATQRAAVPDDQNAAPVVLEAASQLPEKWPDKTGTPFLERMPKSIVDTIRETEPVEQLDAEVLQATREELLKVEPALQVAHRLAGFRTGRYPDLSFEDYHFGKGATAYYQKIGQVGKLLFTEAALRAEEGKAPAALEAGRCCLITGCSIGDEPELIAHLIRNACRQLAVQSIERTLAQVEATDEDLAATQRLLQEEQAVNTLVMALRGERAFRDQVMTWVDADDHDKLTAAIANIDQVMTSPEHPWLTTFCHFFMVGWLKENHAVMLELSNEAVEIAKLPVEEQPARFQKLGTKARQLHYNEGWPPYRYAYGTLGMPAINKVAESYARTEAALRCAIVALAAERFRLVHSRWPDSLEELTPRFLTAIPLDPFDGKPLKLRRFDDGILIYSIGPDGVDNGGKIDRKAPLGTKDLDMGCRLWNVPSRRQAPRLPKDVEKDQMGEKKK